MQNSSTIVLGTIICLTITGCADLQYLNTIHLSKKEAKYMVIDDGKRFVIIPFNEDAEQLRYAKSVGSIMKGFSLTVVDSFVDIDEAKVDPMGKESDDATQVASSGAGKEEKISGSDNDKVAVNSTAADKKTEYFIETMANKDGDGTVKFIRRYDKTVLGIFSISPVRFTMRPQLYAALVKMKLLTGRRSPST